jgi:hypothetical protein
MSSLLNRVVTGIALAAALAPAVAPSYASEVPSSLVKDAGAVQNEDPVALPVAQPVDFIVNQYLQQRGGYDSLKRTVSVDYYGKRLVGRQHYPLHARTARPDTSDTLIRISKTSRFESIRTGRVIHVKGHPRGLTLEDERALLKLFDFDGAIVDWRKQNYAIKRLCMELLPGVLSWKA